MATNQKGAWLVSAASTNRLEIDPDLLEDGKDMATCPVCHLVLDEPTSGCPEGHTLCRPCYDTELSRRKVCPVCAHATDESKLVRCRPFENLIGQLRLRCRHGLEAGGGGGEGGAAPRAKRAKQDPDAKPDPEATPMPDVDEEGAQRCSWTGRVCQLAGHLAESCGFEPVACPNAVAGCKESVLRKDAARHASETCEYRKNRCAHCANPFEARALAAHEASCPEAQIPCPNAGCVVTVARSSMGEHRGGCGREAVGCPCPGCEERMARAEVDQHVAASGAVHLRRAWGRAAQMEDKVAEQAKVIAVLQQKVAAQDVTNGMLQRRAEAVTRVFTWSTNSAWTTQNSPPYTFTDGLRGRCYSSKNKAAGIAGGDCWMGFILEEGPSPCTMHFQCSILDKDEKVVRVVSPPASSDLRQPPFATAPVGKGKGHWFSLSATDTARAGRADGSIRLRAVVYLYPPQYM